MIFETHGHYDDEQFDTDREQLLEEFQRQDIRYVMNIGANIATSKASVELAHQYDLSMQRSERIRMMHRSFQMRRSRCIGRWQ